MARAEYTAWIAALLMARWTTACPTDRLGLAVWAQHSVIPMECRTTSTSFHTTARTLIPRNTSMLVVGNGPSVNQNKTAQRKFKNIVRFNRFYEDGSLGSVTTIHVVNVHTLIFKAPLIIDLECENRHLASSNYHVHPGQTLCTPTPNVLKCLCKQDPSRGFMFLAIFRTPNTQIIGFDGQGGHYWNKRQHLSHNMLLESHVLRRLGWNTKIT